MDGPIDINDISMQRQMQYEDSVARLAAKTQDDTPPDDTPDEQPDGVAEMLAAARASRGTVDGSPYSTARQDEVDEYELAAEWTLSADATLADENEALRKMASTSADRGAYGTWMTYQFFRARQAQHAAEARVVDAERARDAALNPEVQRILVKQWEDLVDERNTLQTALDTAHARIKELEAATPPTRNDWYAKYTSLQGQYGRDVSRLRAELNCWRRGAGLPTFEDLGARMCQPYTPPLPPTEQGRRAAFEDAIALALGGPLPGTPEAHAASERAFPVAEPVAEQPAPDDNDTASCASVRMDNASLRPHVEVPPLVRKPAKMTDEEAEIQFPDNQWESADPAA